MAQVAPPPVLLVKTGNIMLIRVNHHAITVRGTQVRRWVVSLLVLEEVMTPETVDTVTVVAGL